MKYAVFVLGLLAASYVNAQDHLKDFSLKRSLKQDGLHLQFMVLDADKKGVRHHQPSKFYYWTKAQHVRATQGASSGLLLHGLFEAFYPDKQLAQKGSYKKGLKHGTWKYWHEDGTFQRVEKWSHGELSGKQLFYDEQGHLSRTEWIRGTIKKRVQTDSIIHWKAFDRKTIILLDSNGRKTEVQHFKNGVLHGVQKTFADGKVESKQRYKNGELIEKESKKDEEVTSTSEATNEEKEPGKLKQLWQNIFKKDKKEKTKQEKETKEEKKGLFNRKKKEEGEEG
ncbi:MAG: hypothetical protein NXI10_05620 [bacterium]|nr:hypothetical protein [bacterium]